MEEIGIPAQCCCFGKDDIQWQVNPCSAGQYSQFTPSWAQRRHNMGNIASNEASSIAKTWKIPVIMYQWKGLFEDFGLGRLCMSPFWSHMDLNLGRSCSKMGPSWGQVAPSWSQVGPKLEPIGPSRAEVGALLAEDDPKSGQCCGHVGSKWCLLTILCRSAGLQNVQITTARALFLATAPGRTWTPPSWSCTRDWQIGPFVWLAAKLPRLGTFGAGGFPSRSSWHFAGAKVDKSSRYMSLLQSCPGYDAMML